MREERDPKLEADKDESIYDDGVKHQKDMLEEIIENEGKFRVLRWEV